jgi:hydroxylamine dehydrogenase
MLTESTTVQGCLLFGWLLLASGTAMAQTAATPGTNQACTGCHQKRSAALVKQWEDSRHGQIGVGCVECHRAAEGEIDAWKHQGAWIAALVTPLDCARCHRSQYEEFTRSHHARAGEILASLDNVLAEKVAGTPDNKADAVNGCWQCHGSIIRFRRGADGEVERTGAEQRPVIDPDTWPNSGMGRLNPDGSKGSCHACHSRHSFEAKLARNPENCGKCHMGPDHPQIEIYNESKHGIAFYANRSTHDVGERISWTLRPVVSTKINLVRYEDGTQDDYPDTRRLPEVGETVDAVEHYVENGALLSRTLPKKVAEVVPWQKRRESMQGVCRNCHGDTYVENFYHQFDSLVMLYNEKFARPAQRIMEELYAEGLLKKSTPFSEDVQWTFWELWHHEGRRARHGASMMGPDYTHWHGMYEVSKHFYEKFLPQIVELAERHGEGEKWRSKIDALLAQPEHAWIRGLSPEEAKALQKSYERRYDEKSQLPRSTSP